MNKLAELKTDWESRDIYVLKRSRGRKEGPARARALSRAFQTFPRLLRHFCLTRPKKENGGFRACHGRYATRNALATSLLRSKGDAARE